MLTDYRNTPPMPVLFLGHGSPMNAITENEFVEGFRRVGKELPRPEAILCISAHWETRGTCLTAVDKPRTIHDFGGFPAELFAVQYPAPGDPVLARAIQAHSPDEKMVLDDRWGLDHGCWSVVKHLYPEADVPVIEMSLDYHKSPKEHYLLAKELAWLRSKGVLIIGSGNIVHNLGLVDWKKLDCCDYAFDWALEASGKIRQFILDDDHSPLINYMAQGKSFQLAIPTPDHFLPLLYTLALKGENEPVTLFNDKAVGGSLTMTSLKIG